MQHWQQLGAWNNEICIKLEHDKFYLRVTIDDSYVEQVESGSVPTQKQSRSSTWNIEFFLKYKKMRKFRNLVI
jgi:hypothetical protein